MLESSLKIMEAKVQDSSLSEADKNDLLQQIETIKSELKSLSKEDEHGASSIAGYAAMKTHESLAKDKDEDLIDAATAGLNRNLRKFQASHPDIATSLDLLFRTLSRLGV